jgi:hypothetical protein
MGFSFERYTTLELQFSDGTLKILSLRGMTDSEKREWKNWASKLYESETFISGWSID